MTLIKVFISYAHENDIFREQIKQLRDWLIEHGGNRVKIISDFDLNHKAPRQGLQVWMEDGIEEADVVLIICTPKYNGRFRKQELGTGKGATWEGAIITQELYDANLINDKFIPIVPDGQDDSHVPRTLRPFFMYLTFPAKNKQILSAILQTEVSSVEVIQEVIVKEIFTEPVLKPIMSHTEVLIRSFLALSEAQKKAIAKKLGVFDEDQNRVIPLERYKAMFRRIHQAALLSELWEQVNAINPFGSENPFKS